jgi:2-iminobutanoate/2-iminopropanoate deaminase
MYKQAVITHTAPAAIGPYSQGIRSGKLLFLSGQVPVDPANGKRVDGDAATQAHQVCKNILALLQSQGLAAEHVVKTTIFLTDMAAFASVNDVYKQYFPDPSPARSCVAVSKLPLDSQIEIEAIAVFPEGM